VREHSDGGTVQVMNNESLEVVGTFLTRVDAELARSALEAQDIEATVAADDAAGMRPHLWLSGVKVWVRSTDAARARAILQAAEANS
jgi:glycine/serine hydroxymethyltransferase